MFTYTTKKQQNVHVDHVFLHPFKGDLYKKIATLPEAERQVWRLDSRYKRFVQGVSRSFRWGENSGALISRVVTPVTHL